jgi:hypothetical protein
MAPFWPFRRGADPAQLNEWNATESGVAGLEEQLRRVRAMQAACPDGWNATLYDAYVFKIGACREIVDTIGKIVADSSGHSAAVDQKLAFVNENLTPWARGLSELTATVFASQVVVNEDRRAGVTRTAPQSLRDGHLALQRLAESERDAVQAQLAAVVASGRSTAVSERVRTVEFPELDEVVHTSRRQLDATAESFGPGYTVVLAELVSQLSACARELSEDGADSVMVDVMREALRNTVESTR